MNTVENFLYLWKSGIKIHGEQKFYYPSGEIKEINYYGYGDNAGFEEYKTRIGIWKTYNERRL